MKVKLAWYSGGVLILGLTILAVSCATPEEPAVQAPVAPIYVPPAIPHPLEGRANCLMCHETGVGGAPRFPASHEGRPSDVCLTCHVQAPSKNGVSALPTVPPPTRNEDSAQTIIPKPPTETTPAAVSAGELFGDRCAACHGANRQGIPGLASALTPERLAALSDTEIRDAILDGRPGTAMPAFKGTLSPEEIDALLQLIKYTAP